VIPRVPSCARHKYEKGRRIRKMRYKEGDEAPDREKGKVARAVEEGLQEEKDVKEDDTEKSRGGRGRRSGGGGGGGGGGGRCAGTT